MTKKKSPEDLLPKGRPSGYKPEYCDKVIEMGKNGASKTEMADALETTVRTLYNWMEANPDFLHAMERAEQKAEIWWAEQGKKALWTPGFNTAAWSRAMSARFPKTWRENKNVELTGKDGEAVAMNVTTTLNVDQMSARALDALEEALEIMIANEDDEDDEDDDQGPAN